MSGHQVILAFSFSRLRESLEDRDIFELFGIAMKDHFINKFGGIDRFESEIQKYDDPLLDQFEFRSLYLHFSDRYLAFGASIKEINKFGSMFYFWDDSRAATEEMVEDGKSMVKSLSRSFKSKLEIQKLVCVGDYGNTEIEDVLFNSEWTSAVLSRMES